MDLRSRAVWVQPQPDLILTVISAIVSVISCCVTSHHKPQWLRNSKCLFVHGSGVWAGLGGTAHVFSTMCSIWQAKSDGMMEHACKQRKQCNLCDHLAPCFLNPHRSFLFPLSFLPHQHAEIREHCRMCAY